MKITSTLTKNRAHGNNDVPPGQALRFLTQEISINLLESMSYVSEKPSKILCLGPDFEPDNLLLKGAFSEAEIVGDREPLLGAGAAETYDLVFASHALLYTPDLIPTLTSWHRALKTDRPIFFASLGPKTLLELQHSFWDAGSEATHTTPWMDLHDLGDLVLKAGFSDPVMHSDLLTFEYSSLGRFFEELKRVGANQWLQPSRSGLIGAQLWKRMKSIYEERFKTAAGKIPGTVEVIYGHAWKKAERFSSSSDSGEVYISVDNIQRR